MRIRIESITTATARIDVPPGFCNLLLLLDSGTRKCRRLRITRAGLRGIGSHAGSLDDEHHLAKAKMVDVIIALKNEQEEGVFDIDGGEEEEEDVEKVARRRRKTKTKACDPHKKRACVDCTNRCARIHARFSSSSSSSKAPPIPAVPSFFKVMLGYFSEKMEIPPAFAKTILDLAGSNIYLEDSFGLRWRVRVCLRDGALSFGHGWKNFVLDHAVGCGEFLVFRQIARSVFTVQVFAPSAVERLHLCEKNQRQSRKRKPRQRTSSTTTTGVPTVKKKNGERGKKKRRTTGHQHDQVPVVDCKMAVLACIDYPCSASDQVKYSETSEKAPQAGAAESPEIQDDCTIFTEHPTTDATETENVQGSTLPAHVDACAPLAMMDLSEEGSITDIYLSADIYEFESDICNPEAFPSDQLDKQELVTNGQASGFNNCLDLHHDLPNQHSSMEVARGVTMSEVLPCIETRQMGVALETGNKGAASVRAHDIDINVFAVNEPSSFGEDNSSLPTDAELTLGECALGSCSRHKCACSGNQAAQKEDSSAIQDKPQDGQVNMQGSTEQHAAEIMSSSSKPNELRHPMKETDNNSRDLQSESTESGSVQALGVNSGKFCVAVPPPDQTWLELPIRLPVIPRTKKQGRKVVILKDPCMRDWPVLYHCTPRFSGFITGWMNISRENNMREGDTCEFEFSGKYGLSFQVRNSNCCPAT